MNYRNRIAKFAQIGLIVDGGLHLLEVASAYYEEAYATMAITSLHSLLFFVSAYFVGHDLTHRHDGVELNTWSLAKKTE